MNYIQDFTAFIQYFRTLSEKSSYFKFFETGGTEKIVNERLVSDLRGRVSYPVLFVEWPFLHLNDFGSSNTQLTFRSAFVVLEDPAKDDWKAQDMAMQSSLDATLQVLNQMRIDNGGLNKKFLYFDLNKISIDPIDNLLIDNAFGWRCEFEVINPVSINFAPYCRNESFWKPG
jgi:hypothetical protein